MLNLFIICKTPSEYSIRGFAVKLYGIGFVNW